MLRVSRNINILCSISLKSSVVLRNISWFDPVNCFHEISIGRRDWSDEVAVLNAPSFRLFHFHCVLLRQPEIPWNTRRMSAQRNRKVKMANQQWLTLTPSLVWVEQWSIVDELVRIFSLKVFLFKRSYFNCCLTRLSTIHCPKFQSFFFLVLLFN